MSFKKLPVGTCLALETIATPNTTRVSDGREVPKYDDLQKVETVIFDVFTLARDVVNSMPKEQLTLTNAQDLLLTAFEGISEITELTGVSSYINSYDYMKQYKEYHVTHKEGTMTFTRSKLLDTIMMHFNPTKYDITVEKGIPFKDTLLYSHHAYFLVKMLEIGKILIVLESHTGRVLTKDTLGLKYKNVKKYDRTKLPFNRRLLLIFGDGLHIKSQDSKTIQMVVDRSINWNISTPDSTIKTDLNKLGL